jgi:hypothetical protein
MPEEGDSVRTVVARAARYLCLELKIGHEQAALAQRGVLYALIRGSRSCLAAKVTSGECRDEPRSVTPKRRNRPKLGGRKHRIQARRDPPTAPHKRPLR